MGRRTKRAAPSTAAEDGGDRAGEAGKRQRTARGAKERGGGAKAERERLAAQLHKEGRARREASEDQLLGRKEQAGGATAGTQAREPLREAGPADDDVSVVSEELSSDDEEGKDAIEEQVDYVKLGGGLEKVKARVESRLTSLGRAVDKKRVSRAAAAVAQRKGDMAPGVPASGDAGVGTGAVPGRGVVYLGHVPHGFYEDQMRGFFSQFGEVTRLRLSRSPKSGRPRGYAFVEFEHDAVARVVAETMNGYFLAGKVLVCHLLPADKVHPRLFVGANRPFRVVPSRVRNRSRHNRPLDDAQVVRRQRQARSNAAKKIGKLQRLGFDYELPLPDAPPAAAAGAEEEEEEEDRSGGAEPAAEVVAAPGKSGKKGGKRRAAKAAGARREGAAAQKKAPKGGGKEEEKEEEEDAAPPAKRTPAAKKKKAAAATPAREKAQRGGEEQAATSQATPRRARTPAKAAGGARSVKKSASARKQAAAKTPARNGGAGSAKTPGSAAKAAGTPRKRTPLAERTRSARKRQSTKSRLE